MAVEGFATRRDIERVIRSVLHTERTGRGAEGVALPEADNKHQVWFPFRNDYAGDVPAYGVVAITGNVPQTDNKTAPIYKADRPSTTFYQLYGANSGFAVPSGEYGYLRLSGPCLMAYDSGTPAAGEGWGPKPSQFTLSKGFPGGTIVSGIQDSTNKLLLGTLAPIGTCLVKTTGAVTASSATTSYRIYAGTLGSEADAGFTTVPSALSRTAIATTKWGRIVRINNGWELEPLEC